MLNEGAGGHGASHLCAPKEIEATKETLLRLPDLECPSRDAPRLVAARIAVAAAVAAVQLKADGAHAATRLDLVAAHTLSEDAPVAAVPVRDQDFKIAATGAAERGFTPGA